MKTATTILSILTFLIACGQVNQEKSVLIESAKDTQKEKDIAKLWVQEIKSQSYLKRLDENSAEHKSLDISNILAYNDTIKNETPGFFSTYIGALGQNFERIEFHFYSASKVSNQDYDIKLLMKKGKVIDTLQGHLSLIEAFEFPNLFNDESMRALIFLCDFNFVSKNLNRGLTIKGTSSISFVVKDGIAENIWMADGTLSEYVRTFVGYYFDDKMNIKQNCVFTLEPAGLYTYLPFCDELYYIDEENYSPDYYLIKDKYLKFGWKDYDYRDPKKDEWWKK